MRSIRKAYILILLVLLQLSLTACSEGSLETDAGKSIEARSGRLEKDTAVNAMVQEPEEHSNTGVIVDTVADVFREPNVQSERVTQAIFNQPVILLGTEEAWTKVRVVDGCTGWVKSKFVDVDSSSINPQGYEYRLIITSKLKSIYNQSRGGAAIKDIVMGTEFFIINKLDNWYQVALPGKASGWVNESGTIRIGAREHIPKTTAADLVSTASRLKGAVYLWGGMSGLGIDGSGLTYISGRINGIDLPRDAGQQFTRGKEVAKEVGLMKPGDLVFFSSNKDGADISHVGIYIGKGQFIYAAKSSGAVVTGTLEDNYFKRLWVGVKRIVDE